MSMSHQNMHCGTCLSLYIQSTRTRTRATPAPTCSLASSVWKGRSTLNSSVLDSLALQAGRDL